MASTLSRLSVTVYSDDIAFFGGSVCLFHHQEEFLSLCVDKLTEILASDFLNVPNEEMAFEAAMLWLNRCPSRKQSFEKVSHFCTLIFVPLVHSSLSLCLLSALIQSTSHSLSQKTPGHHWQTGWLPLLLLLS